MQISRLAILTVLSLALVMAVGCGYTKARQVSSITVTCQTCIFPNGATGVEFAPSNQLIMDITEGQVEQLSVTLLGAHGESLTGALFPITYSTNDPAAISISPSGEVCGGVWDANFVVCRPGTLPRICTTPVDPLYPPAVCPPPTPSPTPTPAPGATPTPAPTPDALIDIKIVALNAGVTIHVKVHPQIDKITIDATYPNSADPNPAAHCITQNVVASATPNPSATPSATPYSLQFTPKAFSNQYGDVTVDVGFFSWLISDGTVAQIGTNGLAVSRASGVAYVTAAVDPPNGTFSQPFALVVCPVHDIRMTELSPSGGSVTNIAVNPGDASVWLADAKDTQGNSVSTAPITFSSSNQGVASFTSTGLVEGTLTAADAGFTSIVSSCTPPKCNGGPTGVIYTIDGPKTPQELGFGFPIYSNAVQAVVSGSTTSNVFVTGTQALLPGPSPTPGLGPSPTPIPNTQLQILNSVTLAQVNVLNLPYVPNSIVFDPQGLVAYLGTNDSTYGATLMLVASGSTSVTTFSGTITGNPSIRTVTGKVLAISPDLSTIIVSDVVNHNLFVIDKVSNSAQVFPIGGITSAAFSPDSSKGFLAGSSGVYVVTTGQNGIGQGLQQIPGVGSTTLNSTVAFLPDGRSALVSNVDGSNDVAYATCDSAQLGAPFASNAGLIVATQQPGVTPFLVGASLDGSSWTVDSIASTAGCEPTISLLSRPPEPLALAGTSPPAGCMLTQMPAQITALSSGSAVYATSMNTASCGVPFYNIPFNYAGSIALTPAGYPVAGSATLDQNTLIVGTTTGFTSNDTASVHLIHTGTGLNPGNPTDTLQVSVPFIPNLIAVQPK